FTSLPDAPHPTTKPSSQQAHPTKEPGKRHKKSIAKPPASSPPSQGDNEPGTAHPPTSDTELLQAIAHEVRTPLTTIRTLTRLLLRRKDLNPDVIKRLEVIDRECTEQIDRFSLIFRAVELETAQTRNLLTSLAPISLERVLQQNIPRWQQQASQHNHTLDIILPQKMPSVVTDPAMLDQVLTGLIDRITHSLPPGSHIQVQVSLAGHQLKLQLESQPLVKHKMGSNQFGFASNLKSIGQLLMFQPETGNLSLNLSATKNLFQALGGKLIVRQRPEQGEVLTIFLPLEAKKE
ncbi:sensor histidine kinase, partial [filamentous cyanobacterium CCP1]